MPNLSAPVLRGKRAFKTLRHYENLLVFAKLYELPHHERDKQIHFMAYRSLPDQDAEGMSRLFRQFSTPGGVPSHACAGDIPTQEMVPAAWWLRHHLPELKVRVVNVVDLMKLYPSYLHPHGVDDASFTKYFTEDRPVAFKQEFVSCL